jgi:hypothetical protein
MPRFNLIEGFRHGLTYIAHAERMRRNEGNLQAQMRTIRRFLEEVHAVHGSDSRANDREVGRLTEMVWSSLPDTIVRLNINKVVVSRDDADVPTGEQSEWDLENVEAYGRGIANHLQQNWQPILKPK